MSARGAGRWRGSALAAGLLLASFTLSADADLMELSLEELSEITLTSVSKRSQALQMVPAAVTVISREEIQNAATSLLPELLRQVPGLHVARVNAHSWAISARGFNSPLADKMEVRLDGRTLYTPLYSGVFWDQQVPDPDQIERIEVMRGPAGTLWGSNAVNGVINIVSRSARLESGRHLSLGGGLEQRAGGVLRWAGAALGGGLSARLLAQDIDASVLADGSDGGDGWRYAALSLRGDWDRWSLLGQHHQGRDGSVGGDITVQTSSLLLGRSHRGDHYSGTTQIYWDGSDRRISQGFFERRDSFDLSHEQNLRLGERHDLVWGLGYRLSSDRTGGSPSLIFSPAERQLQLFSAYVQDQWLIGEAQSLSLGSKFEHNDFTGFEFQPSLRYAWIQPSGGTLWAAVSRAVRTPNRLDHDARLVGAADRSPESAAEDLDGGAAGNLPDLGIDSSEQGCREAGGVPALCALLFGNGTPQSYDECRAVGLTPRVCELLFDQAVQGDLLGNPAFRSERLIGYELGWRRPLTATLGLDGAIYYNRYSDLRGVRALANGDAEISNELEGRSFGGEWLLGWRATPQQHWQLGYSYLDLDLRPRAGSADTRSAAREGNDPRHQGFLRLLWRPRPSLSLNLALRHVGELPAQSVAAYTELDANLNWRLTPQIGLRLSGNNLLRSAHAEFGSDRPKWIERNVFLSLGLDW